MQSHKKIVNMILLKVAKAEKGTKLKVIRICFKKKKIKHFPYFSYSQIYMIFFSLRD